MTAAKRKGTAWESQAAAFLSAILGFTVRRIAQAGKNDIGDLDISLFAVECKNVHALAIPDWIRQANREAAHKGEPFGVVLVKRPRNKTGDNWAILDLDTFARLIKRLYDAEESSAREIRGDPEPPSAWRGRFRGVGRLDNDMPGAQWRRPEPESIRPRRPPDGSLPLARLRLGRHHQGSEPNES